MHSLLLDIIIFSISNLYLFHSEKTLFHSYKVDYRTLAMFQSTRPLFPMEVCQKHVCKHQDCFSILNQIYSKWFQMPDLFFSLSLLYIPFLVFSIKKTQQIISNLQNFSFSPRLFLSPNTVLYTNQMMNNYMCFHSTSWMIRMSLGTKRHRQRNFKPVLLRTSISKFVVELLYYKIR